MSQILLCPFIGVYVPHSKSAGRIRNYLRLHSGERSNQKYKTFYCIGKYHRVISGSVSDTANGNCGRFEYIVLYVIGVHCGGLGGLAAEEPQKSKAV